MLDTKTLSHMLSGENPPADRIRAVVETAVTAENVLYTRGSQCSASQMFNLWWNSAGHQANIRDLRFNAVGISVIADGDWCFATACFASLASFEAPPAPITISAPWKISAPLQYYPINPFRLFDSAIPSGDKENRCITMNILTPFSI